MLENELLLDNEISISHIQHDFFNDSDNETFRSDSKVYENNLETVYTFNNEVLQYACKIAEEKEEITDDELLKSLSNIDDELFECLSNSDESLMNIETESILIRSEKSTSLFTNNNMSQIFTACCQLVEMWEIAENAVQENLLDQNLQISCISQTYYPALKQQNCFLIIQSTTNSSQSYYVCCNCFEKNSSYLYYWLRKGKPIKTYQKSGLHNKDTTLALKLLSKLIFNITEFSNTKIKRNLLNYLSPTLQILIDN
ncbi:2436_t:CDS:2, partial [Scutellospora calospora]